MSAKRLILLFLTVVVSLLMGLALIKSFSKPQVRGQLQLYQTNLLLQASAWNGGDDPQFAPIGMLWKPTRRQRHRYRQT
jgi:uncharacterized protein